MNVKYVFSNKQRFLLVAITSTCRVCGGVCTDSRELVDPRLVVVPMPFDPRGLGNVLRQQLERLVDRSNRLLAFSVPRARAGGIFVST